MKISARITQLEKKAGSLRKLGEILGCSVSYLSNCRSKEHAGEEMLKKLGLVLTTSLTVIEGHPAWARATMVGKENLDRLSDLVQFPVELAWGQGGERPRSNAEIAQELLLRLQSLGYPDANLGLDKPKAYTHIQEQMVKSSTYVPQEQSERTGGCSRAQDRRQAELNAERGLCPGQIDRLRERRPNGATHVLVTSVSRAGVIEHTYLKEKSRFSTEAPRRWSWFRNGMWFVAPIQFHDERIIPLGE